MIASINGASFPEIAMKTALRVYVFNPKGRAYFSAYGNFTGTKACHFKEDIAATLKINIAVKKWEGFA